MIAMRRSAALAAFTLALAGCGGAADAPDSAEPEALATVAEQVTLDLQATGIIIPAQGALEQLEVPFGSARGPAEATLGAVAGAVVERGVNGECGAGPMEMTQFDGLVLNFQDDAFVGWSATAPYVPDLPRGEMLGDPAVALVEGSTLGEEFTIGDAGGPMISGLFAGSGDGAAVETLWAGTNRVFR
jgi:hypothetical protein